METGSDNDLITNHGGSPATGWNEALRFGIVVRTQKGIRLALSTASVHHKSLTGLAIAKLPPMLRQLAGCGAGRSGKPAFTAVKRRNKHIKDQITGVDAQERGD